MRGLSSASHCWIIVDGLPIMTDTFAPDQAPGPAEKLAAFTSIATPEPADAGGQAHPGPNDPAATTKELYSYYAYYAGNNGIGSFQ